MNLDDVRALAAAELANALDEIGIQPGWLVADGIRAARSVAPSAPCLDQPADAPKQAFQNLVVGTIAERVFRNRYLAALESEGFEVVDYHERGENRDYAIQQAGLELPINVKVASTLFRNAKITVGLESEDCIPISAYKALGASERVPTLLYVDLVDFTLRGRVDAFMAQRTEALAIGWHLLSRYRGPGAKKAEDQYVNTLFERHPEELESFAPGSTSYRVISAQRVLAIMRDNPRRVPGLGVKGAGTGAFIAEVNVHISVRDETRPWSDIVDTLTVDGIQPLLDQIMSSKTAQIPDPQL